MSHTWKYACAFLVLSNIWTYACAWLVVRHLISSNTQSLDSACLRFPFPGAQCLHLTSVLHPFLFLALFCYIFETCFSAHLDALLRCIVLLCGHPVRMLHHLFCCFCWPGLKCAVSAVCLMRVLPHSLWNVCYRTNSDLIAVSQSQRWFLPDSLWNVSYLTVSEMYTASQSLKWILPHSLWNIYCLTVSPGEQFEGKCYLLHRVSFHRGVVCNESLRRFHHWWLQCQQGIFRCWHLVRDLCCFLLAWFSQRAVRLLHEC